MCAFLPFFFLFVDFFSSNFSSYLLHAGGGICGFCGLGLKNKTTAELEAEWKHAFEERKVTNSHAKTFADKFQLFELW